MPTELARQELRRAAIGRPTALTVGVFDGVHRGHQALLRRVEAIARAEGLAPGVVTFYPHPRQVLFPDEPMRYLTSLEDRLDLLRESGMACVATVTFTSALAQLDAEVFVRLMHEELHLAHLVIGPDFALGRQRGGDAPTLRSLGDRLGFRVSVIDPVRDDGGRISSTEIRQALEAGDIGRVNALLGRRFSLHGPVIHGEERGRVLGVPTANVAVGADRALPAYGVYATLAVLDGGAPVPAVTNIGVRPTFHGEARPSIECHLLDFSGDLYGRELRLILVERLRSEQTFDGVEALRAQIVVDTLAARRVLRI